MGGSRLRSIGFMMMKTCWFLCVKPVSSLSAALQKYCTQPCFPRNVEGRPRGRPSLKGKLWMPADSKTDSPPAMKKYLINIICCSKMESVNSRSKMGSSCGSVGICSSCFQHHRSLVRIQSSSNFIYHQLY